jgi:hypothetical protein
MHHKVQAALERAAIQPAQPELAEPIQARPVRALAATRQDRMRTPAEAAQAAAALKTRMALEEPLQEVVGPRQAPEAARAPVAWEDRRLAAAD